MINLGVTLGDSDDEEESGEKENVASVQAVSVPVTSKPDDDIMVISSEDESPPLQQPTKRAR